MGDGSADGPADGDEAHDDGVEGHYVRVADGVDVGADHHQDGVSPKHAGDAHGEEDDEGCLDAGGVCECDGADGPDQTCDDGGETGAAVQADEGDQGGSSGESTSQDAGHQSETDTAAVEDTYGVLGDEREDGEAEEVGDDEHGDEPWERLRSADIAKADSEGQDVGMAVVAEAGVLAGHRDVEDQVGAGEVEDGDEDERPIGTDEGDDDADGDGSDEFAEVVCEDQDGVGAGRGPGLDDVSEEGGERRPCEGDGESGQEGEDGLVPGSHGVGADEDGLDDCEEADECPHGGDEDSMVYAVADVCGDCWAEEGWDGAECGDSAYPKAGLREIVCDPGLGGDAGQDADVDYGFGCDDPVEAAVGELVEDFGAVPVYAAQERTGG